MVGGLGTLFSQVFTLSRRFGQKEGKPVNSGGIALKPFHLGENGR
jgi:hypothetical protein